MKRLIIFTLIICSVLSLVSCEDTINTLMLGLFRADPNSMEIEGGFVHWVEVEGGYELDSIIMFDDNVKHTNFDIPREYNGKPVVSIGETAFFGWSDLESITIPDTVKSIGNGAFAFCSSLKSIVIPDSVTYMGTRVFSYCHSLESVVMSEEITVLTSRMFEMCSMLKSIKTSLKLTVVEDNVFDSCLSCPTLHLTKNITKFYYTTFAGQGYVNYDGTMEEWMQVERLIGESDDDNSWTVFVRCTDGTLLVSDTIDHMVLPDGFVN